MTVRFGTDTEGQPWFTSQARRCVYCTRLIRWMSTYEGSTRCFDGEPVPRDLDVEEAGWIPDTIKVGDRNRTVMSPLVCVSEDKRQRAQTVLHLHLCTGGRQHHVAA